MAEKDYSQRGSTAPLNAIGGAIYHIDKYVREREVPEHTVLTIAEGLENAGNHYNAEKIKKMIGKEKSTAGNSCFLVQY